MNKRLSIKQIERTRQSIENGLRVFCRARADFLGFDGHFKDKPVLPGVCQLSFVIELINQLCPEKKVVITQIDRMKFNNLIVPEQDFVIEVIKRENKWDYSLFNDNEKYSSGTMVIE